MKKSTSAAIILCGLAIVLIASIAGRVTPGQRARYGAANAKSVEQQAWDKRDADFRYDLKQCEEQNLQTDKCNDQRFVLVLALKKCDGIASDHCIALRDLYHDIYRRDFHIE